MQPVDLGRSGTFVQRLPAGTPDSISMGIVVESTPMFQISSSGRYGRTVEEQEEVLNGELDGFDMDIMKRRSKPQQPRFAREITPTAQKCNSNHHDHWMTQS